MRTFVRLSASLIALCLSAGAAAAEQKFEKQVPAEAQGVVEVTNTSGTIDVTGWDKTEVDVRAELGAGVERVDVNSDHGRTTIKVVLPGNSIHNGDARLRIQVPKGSELHVSAVSADVSVNGVLGTQRLNSVSGDLTTEIAGADLELKSVSGDVKVKGHGQPARLHVSTVSGDVHLDHGAGDLEAATVSGELMASLDNARSVRARTTSGDMRLEAKLAKGATFDAATVSGDLNVKAPADGGYVYEVSSFSGEITDCFGARSDKSGIVGQTISGTRGEGAGHLRLKAMSGHVQLCDHN